MCMHVDHYIQIATCPLQKECNGWKERHFSVKTPGDFPDMSRSSFACCLNERERHNPKNRYNWGQTALTLTQLFTPDFVSIVIFVPPPTYTQMYCIRISVKAF